MTKTVICLVIGLCWLSQSLSQTFRHPNILENQDSIGVKMRLKAWVYDDVNGRPIVKYRDHSLMPANNRPLLVSIFEPDFPTFLPSQNYPKKHRKATKRTRERVMSWSPEDLRSSQVRPFNEKLSKRRSKFLKPSNPSFDVTVSKSLNVIS